VVISALGIFGNNFDPNIGDSVKVFYYSFLLLLAFPISICSLLEYIKKGKKTLIIILLILFLFILGFPHAYSTETENALLYKNSTLATCEINYPIIDNIFGFDGEKECEDSKLNKYNYKTDFSNDFKFVFKNIPFVNLAVLVVLLFKIDIYRFFIKKDNR
jgi:ABC-type transport system involved in multi-copper enzyme maturation permease subunit